MTEAKIQTQAKSYKQASIVSKDFVVSESEKGNYPKKKYRAGGVTATVWTNSYVKDGKTGEYDTISLERVYQDKEGNWQSTNTLRLNDLPKVNVLMQKVYEDLVLKEQELFHSEQIVSTAIAGGVE
ncbi:hypothetical protein HOA92_04005 [archaeon]|jgi:hypothetical protein|nr:hypothetical protein [archaeon]MBT6762177.1 hypothetical protein [archaeon]